MLRTNGFHVVVTMDMCRKTARYTHTYFVEWCIQSLYSLHMSCINRLYDVQHVMHDAYMHDTCKKLDFTGGQKNHLVPTRFPKGSRYLARCIFKNGIKKWSIRSFRDPCFSCFWVFFSDHSCIQGYAMDCILAYMIHTCWHTMKHTSTLKDKCSRNKTRLTFSKNSIPDVTKIIFGIIPILT